MFCQNYDDEGDDDDDDDDNDDAGGGRDKWIWLRRTLRTLDRNAFQLRWIASQMCQEGDADDYDSNFSQRKISIDVCPCTP